MYQSHILFLFLSIHPKYDLGSHVQAVDMQSPLFKLLSEKKSECMEGRCVESYGTWRERDRKRGRERKRLRERENQ